jgi:hypothetical protein
MERVATILEKLQAQVKENAPISSLLVQAKMLTAELEFLLAVDNEVPSFGTGKVTVLPNLSNTIVQIEVWEEEVPPPPPTAAVEAPVALATETEPESQESTVITESTVEPPEHIPAEPAATLAEEKLVFELNASFAGDEPVAEINQQLKQFKQELADKLQNTPIKDLKKAITINDRFVFIQELFRGDEAMYERSMKTINGFSILPEATYWIQRELKVKLGWDNNNEVVRYFDDLVNRRFS